MDKTVRAFKQMLESRSGGNYSTFNRRSAQHIAFWEKLNRLGARNMKIISPESVPDIDATVVLSDQEWSELEIELNQLLQA